MACNFKNVLSAGNQCKENPAGLSSHMFAVPLDSEHIQSIGIHNGKNQYVIVPATEGSSLKGYRIDFKSQTGQVTSESNGSGKGWTHTGTGRVDLNEDDMAYMSRMLHNTDKMLYFFPTGIVTPEGKEYKVVGNLEGDTEFSTAADSGAARGDDHGTTFTVTCAYQVYDVMKWYGTIEQSEESSSDFVDDSTDMVEITD